MVKRYIPVLLVVIITVAVIRAFVQPAPFEEPKTNRVIPSVTKVTPQKSISYVGKDGVTALALLQQKSSVIQDTSGLVTAINEYRADSAKHEYWAFYVNGKMAQVGPKEYMTKNSDKIEWKIEKY